MTSKKINEQRAKTQEERNRVRNTDSGTDFLTHKRKTSTGRLKK